MKVEPVEKSIKLLFLTVFPRSVRRRVEADRKRKAFTGG